MFDIIHYNIHQAQRQEVTCTNNGTQFQLGLNNTIIFVQNLANNPKKDRSPIHFLTRKYAQYNSLLHYAQVIHYYQDIGFYT